MITNLPEKIDASILQEFDLGSSEAVRDSILQDCFCDIQPVITFLRDKHHFLVGAKGSGKTAVFTLIKSGNLNFDTCDKEKAIVVGIEEPIEYATAVSTLEKSLKSKVKDVGTHFMYLWEIYLLYRICLSLKPRPDLGELAEKIDVLLKLFSGDRPAVSLLQVITSSKKTVGFKLDMTNPAFPSPDFYVSSEPATEPPTQEMPTHTIRLDEYKAAIGHYLKQRGLILYVLVDNLDDFVAKDNYKTQKWILHGIINCCRGYSKFPQIRIKVSLRADLFQKLDFSQLGGRDKIEPEVVFLNWTDQDIRYFIARRLAFNIMKILKLKGLRFEVDEQSLYLPPPEQTLPLFERVLVRFKKIFPSWHKRDERDARLVTASDQICRMVVLTLFPTEVMHRDDGGSKIRIDLFSYLATHFDLGNGHTTPRIVLIFLQKLVEVALKYYQDNPDEKELTQTAKHDFCLFKREHFAAAYQALQQHMLDVFRSCITAKEWQERLDLFFSRKGKRQVFSFAVLRDMMRFEDEDQVASFTAFLTHLGVLRCKDENIPHQNRMYELPILLQYIWP
jgi:hypothetical protein